MSYILDALKRADAERERGTVPGLRAQPIPATSARASDGARPLQRWVLFAGVLFVALLAAWAWRMSANAPRGEAPMAPAAPIAPISPISTPAPSAPAMTPPAPPAPLARATPAAPPTVARPETRPPEVAKAEPKAARAASAPVAAPARAPASAAAAPEVRAPALAELPEDLKRQLPAPAISGSIYSENPAQRMVTIGSQVFQEGDKPAPDLVLEQIGRKAAVFNFRGTRYTLSY
jgi:general secretion pathway protein B